MLGTNRVTVIGNRGIEIIPVTEEKSGFFSHGFHFETVEDDSDYLQKGEKILNLLREKQKKWGSALSGEKDRVLELVRVDWNHTHAAISRKIGEEFRQKFLSEVPGDEQNQLERAERACADLTSELIPGVAIKMEYSMRMARLMNAVCKSEVKYVLQLQVADTSIYTCADVQNIRRSHERGVKLRGDSGPYERIVGFNLLVTEYYVRGYLLNTLRQIRREAGSFEKYLQVSAIGKLVKKYAVHVPRPFSMETIQAMPNTGLQELCILILYPEDRLANEAALRIIGRDVNQFLVLLREDYQVRKAELKMERHLSGEYAHSYETKKNIPDKCVRAMARSGFNDYFGYVEFDEECDLRLMTELAKEYRAVAKEIGLDRHPEVSLRFRKLGQHKASGLYYYTLKCLCVDVRYPGSMMHETGHMLDYELGHISDTYDFSAIRDRYEELMYRFLKESDPETAKQLNGKTKYNLSYYLLPSEIFARCFEMYLVRHRAIDNSICRPAGIGYPEDSDLEDMIFSYFDGLLGKQEEEEKLKNGTEA